MNFSEITNINIPEGVVSKIATLEGVVLWEKKGVEPDYLTLPKPNNNEIYYTSSGTKDPIYRPDTNHLSNNSIISNTYENGIGKIVFENDLVSVWKNAFDYSASSAIQNFCKLTLVRLPDSIKSIKEKAFYNQKELTSINIPYGVEYIDIGGFTNCGLTSIDIPNTVKYLYGTTFSNCDNLTKLVLPDSIISVGSGICFVCENLKYIRLSENITSLGQQSFFGCDNLNSIRLPENIKSLGLQCFFGCDNLETITLSSSLKTIKQECFCSCYSLHTIICKPLIAPSLEIDVFSYVGENVPEGTPKVLRVPQGASGYDTWLQYLKGFTIEYITE
jgi:hypothetical protein